MRLLAGLLLAGCATVPITGRNQMALIPAQQVLSLGSQSYDKMLKNEKVLQGTKEAAMVEQVGRRVEHAVERYFTQRGMSNRLAGYKWAFNLVESKDRNAACYPGGKVVVFSGLLPTTRDEAGLAAVLGHEIAHAVANHGNERMSQELLVKMGSTVLASSLSSLSPGQSELFNSAFGLGAKYGALLPFSRLHEEEADRLGTIFMAMAGYDPREAIGLWERMNTAEGNGSKNMEWLSTHPLPTSRIQNLRRVIPEAMRYYQTHE
ncbi:MAG: M48 family metallopeptidase [Magnetococcales bacterium]|nr:M48 family metallopeptidase [Magnetococcales bacterium]MBF0323063.1 M48 family metallopeptidase [Magnetococcales bacterium]